MKKIFYVLAAALASFAVACSEEEADTLEVSSSSFVIPADGGLVSLVFTTSNTWNVSSSADWISFDVASGVSGEGVVNVTVAANEDYSSRSADITIASGSKAAKVTVSQTGVSAFGTELTFTIDGSEQDVTIATTSNVDYTVTVDEEASSWLSIVKTKAAPSTGSIVLHAAANNTTDERSGKFVVEADGIGTVQTYVLTQKSAYADYTILSSAEAVYLSNAQYIYESSTYSYTTFNQFAVVLTSENGDKAVLALNAAADADKAVLPTGDFVVDVDGSRSAGTFSLKPTGRTEKYYTTAFESGSELYVIDGEVNVEASEGVYTITASLVDENYKQHQYAYQGEISVADKSFAAQADSPGFNGKYYSYYSTGVNRWSLSLYISAKDNADNKVFLRYITFAINGTSDDVDGSELPTGTFAYSVSEIDPNVSNPCGNYADKANSFAVSNATDESGNSVVVADGASPSLTISKNSDGTYNIEFKGDLVRNIGDYDENWNFVVTESTDFSYSGKFTDVLVPDTKVQSLAAPDEDTEFNYVFNSKFAAFYYGKVFSDTCDVFFFGFTNIGHSDATSYYTVYLSANIKGNYVFEKNFRNRYCTTPFNMGTFAFSQTAEANSLIPLKEGTAARSYIKNAYSGTVFYITEGSVTLDASSIKYDLTAKSQSGVTCKFTGTHAASLYYAQDYTSRASKCGLFEISY